METGFRIGKQRLFLLAYIQCVKVVFRCLWVSVVQGISRHSSLYTIVNRTKVISFSYQKKLGIK